MNPEIINTPEKLENPIISDIEIKSRIFLDTIKNGIENNNPEIIQNIKELIKDCSSLSDAQGLIGEWFVSKSLGNENAVNATLKSWKETILKDGEAKQGSAANIPDGLVIDNDGKIISIIESKMTMSDINIINSRKLESQKSWRSISSELIPSDESGWIKRFDYAWKSNGFNYYSQVKKHIDRAYGINKNGNIDINQDQLAATIFLPQGEDFSDIRNIKNISVNIDGEIKTFPFKCIDMLSIHDTITLIRKAGFDFEPKENQTNSNQEISDRKENIIKNVDFLKSILNTSDINSLDDLVCGLLIGQDGLISVQNVKASVTNVDSLMNRLSSTAPCLVAHIAFDMAGHKQTKSDKITQEQLLTSIPGEDLELKNKLISTILKIRQKLETTKGLKGSTSILDNFKKQFKYNQ